MDAEYIYCRHVDLEMSSLPNIKYFCSLVCYLHPSVTVSNLSFMSKQINGPDLSTKRRSFELPIPINPLH